MTNRGRVDIIIFLIVLGIMLFSLIVVYSASSTFSFEKTGNADFLFGNHFVKVLFGVVALFVFSKIPYQNFQKYSKEILLIAIVLLVATIIYGNVIKGSAREISIGGFGFQPSAFALYALIIHLANLIVKKGVVIQDLKHGFLPSIFWISICATLIMFQPNFSTAALVIIVGIGLLFVGGARFKHIFVSVLLTMPFILIYLLSASYRTERMLDYFKSLVSNEPINHQVYQATIAFGLGGIHGTGIGNSQQRDLFLPEAYGDFIFSIVGEEYGFIGAVVILLCYIIILWRGFKIARNSVDPFGKLTAFGITFAIGLYAFINAGVTCGLFPTTGIPMPFLSYGGTAFLFNAVSIGILLNISSYSNVSEDIQQEIPIEME